MKQEVIYLKNGVKYRSIINAIGKNSLELALLAKGVGKSQVLSVKKV